MHKRLVITADDFGMHPAVNRAVQRAHEGGVLSAASLMMGAPATDQAVDLARRLRTLHIGLHLMVADGWASAPRGEVPALADHSGVMDGRVLARSFRFLQPAAIRQLRRELRAQFDAFERTGLRLDHVNVHKHLHMHPVIFKLVLDEILARGRPPLRIPCEPAWSRGPQSARGLGASLLMRWAGMARRVARRAGVTCNDYVFGLANSGGVDTRVMLGYLARLPPGLSEIYLHPADSTLPLNTKMAGYRPLAELHALLSPEVRLAIARAGARLDGYRAHAGHPGTGLRAAV